MEMGVSHSFYRLGIDVRLGVVVLHGVVEEDHPGEDVFDGCADGDGDAGVVSDGE